MLAETGGRLLVAVESAQVAGALLAVLIQTRDAVLTRDTKAAAELRMVVDQAVTAHNGDPRIARAFDLARGWRVVEDHGEPAVGRSSAALCSRPRTPAAPCPTPHNRRACSSYITTPASTMARQRARALVFQRTCSGHRPIAVQIAQIPGSISCIMPPTSSPSTHSPRSQAFTTAPARRPGSHRRPHHFPTPRGPALRTSRRGATDHAIRRTISNVT